MKNKKEPGISGGKKPYVKPEVRKVTLTPEEAVLGFCKTTGKVGPGTSAGNACHIVVNCSGIGS